jgi:uncharacterized Zn finger protein
MPITELAIRNLASAQSFERGEDYYHNGSVYNVQKRGDMLMAEVEGSSYEPYQVTVELVKDQIVSTDCTCPYDRGGICKHIVAVLLTYLRDSEEIKERPTVEQLLAGLSEADLRSLLIELLATEPRLINWLEEKLAVQANVSAIQIPPAASVQESKAQAQPAAFPPIDPAPFRRQARQILRASHQWDYYATPSIAHEMSALLDQVTPMLEAGAGRNALLALEAIVEPYVDSWYEFDDSDGELGELFGEIGALFAEAILSADLSPQERQDWAEKLTAWQGEIDEYGVDDAFDAAIAAAEQGWDYRPLLKVIRDGEITDQGAWPGEAPWYADELTLARLNVLERQGRTTEYIYLAEAEGQMALYLAMLVKVGRVQEAVENGLQQLAQVDDALAVAKVLREHNHPLEALRIAEHGLTLQGMALLSLAHWLRDFARELSRPDIALKAARVAFNQSFDLEDYQAIASFAGTEWPALKSELLSQLASTQAVSGPVDIYLYEGLIDQAIKIVDRYPYAGYSLVEKVVDAAWQTHPDWVIQQCQKQAEPIMDSGKSDHYYHAARWLEKARRAYLAANRADEWRAYLEGLINKHARKYALRPRLEALRK